MRKTYVFDDQDIVEACKFWITTKYKPQATLDVEVKCEPVSVGYGENAHTEYKPAISVVEVPAGEKG